jgi:DNA-binding LacI/PurR family transcriptional regulator
MIYDRKLVALCTSRVFDPQVHSFIEKLNEELKTGGFFLWIYAINADLYWEDDADESETTVFNIIDWNLTDVVVIMDEKIKSHRVSGRIIDNARKNKVPVVVVDGRYDDTVSISFD